MSNWLTPQQIFDTVARHYLRNELLKALGLEAGL